MADVALQLSQVKFTWAGREPFGLYIEHFKVERGEKVFVTGPSGSGKTTLLNLVAGLAVPQSGTIMLGDKDMASMSGSRRDRLRADRLGLVFQQLNLIRYLSAIGNVSLPTRFSRRRRANVGGQPEQEARRLLGAMDLQGKAADGHVSTLSVGQQQRVAVARAVIGRPSLILADEPTSALDEDNQRRCMALLLEEVKSSNSGLLMVSHEMSLAPHFDRVLALSDFAEAAR